MPEVVSPTVAPLIGLPCSSTTRPTIFPALGNFKFELGVGLAGRVEKDALAFVAGAERVGFMIGEFEARGLEPSLGVDRQRAGRRRARNNRR